MSSLNIVRQSDVIKTARVVQLEGIFDIPPSDKSVEKWEVNFVLPETWNIGLIVGASGSGKTTIARELFGNSIVNGFDWPADKSIVDGFPKSMSIKDICELLSSVGFSSPPLWLRPFRVLSNGEQFRVNMARGLAEQKELLVVDEFTSVVDRTVAKIGSAAIAKTIRRINQKFIAVSCHYDIVEWLEPDWIYQPVTNEFTSGRSLRRPKINLEIKRVHTSAWGLFSKYHYLSGSLNKSAVCFCAFWDGIPVAFIGWLHLLHKVKNMKRITRLVTLPDYQGVGIGRALQTYTASVVKGLGYRPRITSSHPSVIHSLSRDENWRMTRFPQRASFSEKFSKAPIGRTFSTNRLVAAFEYVGNGIAKETAEKIWYGELRGENGK
jgi:ABC-type molybdenum transport system ATPase subunit/photorepair protein PhrA/GNAT superfamily N-acetyltransferase